MYLLTGAVSLKLGYSAIRLIGAAIKAAQKGELAEPFDAAGETVEFVEGLTEAQRVTVAAIAAKVQKRLERGYRDMLEHEVADWVLRADVQAAFSRLSDVLDAGLPDAQAIVEANLDIAGIATLVANNAARLDGQFAEGRIGRQILVQLVTLAYDEVKLDQKFADALQLPIGQELLRRTEHIEHLPTRNELQELLYQAVSRVSSGAGIPFPVLSEILAGFGEPEKVPFEQIEQRLRAKAAEYHELRDRLNSLTNGDPRVQALRHEAASLIDVGKFELADAMLSQAEQIDLIAASEHESLADRHRASAAASRADRGAAASLRLDYRTAAAHFAEAASLAMRDDGAAWKYRMQQGSALSSYGEDFGDNAAFQDAIAAFREALRLTSRARIPHPRAATQNNLGVALGRLGTRERDAARLEEAVAMHRDAIQVLIR